VAVLAASRILWQLSRPVEWEDAEIPDDVERAEQEEPAE
jgi:hypothetical protein